MWIAVVAAGTMAVRIFTINLGEEALVRVNSRKPITLEFPGHLVTIYEENGLIFQRVEKQFPEPQTQEDDEEKAPDDDSETQFMETQIDDDYEPPVEETQLENYDDMEPHIEHSEAEPYGIPYAYAVNSFGPAEYQDIAELDRELYGNN